jgi:hypothetical protein
MTPTLKGRVQTRMILTLAVGALLAWLFGRAGTMNTLLVTLGYLLGLGILWDVIFQWVQRRRWDRDWSPLHQLATGILEGAAFFLLARTGRLPGLGAGVALGQFLPFYGTFWVLGFIILQGPVRVLFPRWRFRGGEWF